ncbi:MAG: hypothetical protein GY835_18900, partial [bacterium]|nr:hypothetical protein [bacterium]
MFDAEGDLYLGGTTNSSNFPFTSGAYDTSYNGGEIDQWGGDLFLTKIPAEYFVDTDLDGYIDIADVCPGHFDPDQADTDGDSFGDSCDNCILWFNPLQEDNDLDSVGNWCDNCPDTYNPDQEDANHNDIGDVCDGCCLPPTVGDVDQSGGVDITDISVLIDNQFL